LAALLLESIYASRRAEREDSAAAAAREEEADGLLLLAASYRIKPIILCKTVAKHRVTRGLCEILMLLSGGLEPEELGHAHSDTTAAAAPAQSSTQSTTESSIIKGFSLYYGFVI
jgi:hypothetical protein